VGRERRRGRRPDSRVSHVEMTGPEKGGNLRDLAVIMIGLAAGCGGVSAQDPDAAIDAPAEIDGDVQPACDLDQPFGAPQLVANVNSDVFDAEGYLSSDGLTLYFASNRAGGLGDTDVWTASRARLDDAFGTPVIVPNVNTADHEGQPVISADGLSLYLSRQPTAGGQWDIYVATRTSVAAAFGTPELLLNVNDPVASDVATDIDATGTTLYLGSTRSGDWEILRATRTSPTGAFGAATPIGELNVAGAEDYGAVLTGDQLTVYFESRRAGSLGCYDIYVAHRSTTGDGFGAPSRVDELSTSDCEYPTWVSADGCQLLFTSTRPGGLGGYDIYVTSHP